MPAEEEADLLEPKGLTVITPKETKFKAQGPKPIGSKKKYKFIEPPGIGSWMFSFAKKCLVCGLVYTLGYFQISVGWLVGPVVLLVVRDQWQRHHEAQRQFAKAMVGGDEREIVLARLGDNLPSWVIFPDVERCEWLNQILKQMWPRINHYAYDLIINSIEPGLREVLSNSYKLGSFRFEKVILGDTPIRIRGVKVYDEKKTDRTEIIMDLDVIYAGDCDFRFSVARIKAGLKDLQLSGTLRVILKPLISQMPLIGGVQYFFLNPPQIDFNLIGIADVLDMPGLSDLIRRIVQEQISNMVVLPNRMFIQLGEGVNARETCAMQPQGVIRICAIEARNLMKMDVGVLGMGKSDPYVVLSVGAQRFRSKTINNTVNPKWEYYCEMLVEELGQKLNVILYDHDDGKADEFLGRCSVDLSLVSREKTMDLWLELEDVKKGQVHLKLEWLGFTSNPVDLKESLVDAQIQGMASCMLTVRLDSAKHLPALSKKGGVGNFGKYQLVREGSKPDPQAILSVGKIQHESLPMEKTTDPVFEETMHFLARNPLTDTLLVKIIDRKTNTELGAFKQPLDAVYGRPEMKMRKQNFTLNTKSEAKVCMSMEIKVLKLGAPAVGEMLSMDEDDSDEEENHASATSSASDIRNNQQGSNSNVNNKPSDDKYAHEDSGYFASSLAKDDIEDSSVRKEEINPSLTSQSSVTSNTVDDDKAVKIRLTIRYSQTSQQLIVVVHSVANLPIEAGELPDPYVKLYILPERNKKHKTDAQKDQCNPLYDERFEFPIIDLRGKTLEVAVCDKKTFRSSPKFGEVVVPLDVFQLGSAVTSWFTLSP